MFSSTVMLRIERVGLEHDADVAAARLDVVDPRTVERDVAAARLVDAGEHQQRRRLAAARRPQHRHEGAILDREIDAGDRRDRADPFLAQVLQLDHGPWFTP